WTNGRHAIAISIPIPRTTEKQGVCKEAIRNRGKGPYFGRNSLFAGVWTKCLNLFVKPVLPQNSHIQEAKRSAVYVNRRPTELAFFQQIQQIGAYLFPHSSDAGSYGNTGQIVPPSRHDFESSPLKSCGVATLPSFGRWTRSGLPAQNAK